MLRTVFVLLIGVSSAAVALAQPASPEAAVAALQRAGFESVRAEAGPEGWVLGFENRRYRYDVRALSVAREIVPEARRVVLYRRGWPLVTLAEAGDGWVLQDVAPEGPSAPARAPARWTLDLLLRPQLAAEFGNFDDPVESQVNVVPEAALQLWKGALARIQWIIPLQNELGDEGDEMRPGLMTLGQVWRFPGAIWASASAGVFTQKRYGLELETLRFFARGRLGIGARLGYTGYLAYRDRTWLYDDLDTVTWSLYGTAALWPALGLAAHVGVSRFLDGDSGLEVAVRRAFGEVEVAFRGVHTTAGTNAGFTIGVPLPVGRHLAPRRVRPRTAERLAWTYWYRSLPDVGRTYATGQRLDAFWEDLHPAYLPARLHREARR